MAAPFQFGLVVRVQAEAVEDITKRFDETIEQQAKDVPVSLSDGG